MKVWKEDMEIECTVEEYKELFSKETQQKPEKEKVVVVQEKDTTKEEKIDLKPVTDAQKRHAEAGRGIKKKQLVFAGKKHKKWTAKEDAYLKNHVGEDREVVGEVLGRTKSGVRNRMQKLGLTTATKNAGNNRENRWSEEEDSYVKNNYEHGNKNTLRVLSQFLGRTETAVYVRAVRLGLAKKEKEEEKPAKKINPDDNRVKRMKFVSSRTQYLCKTNGWNYEKAFRYASQEWEDGKKKHERKLFPVFKTLVDGSERQLIPFVHHAVSNKGTLTLKDVESVCVPFLQSGIWNDTSWDYFVDEFMRLSKEIASYFGVRNRFMLVSDGTTNTNKYIKYG